MPRPMTTLAALAAVTVPLTTFGIVAGASSASADTLDATCTGSRTITYSPGIVLQPRTVEVGVTADYSCISPQVSSGTSSFTINGQRSCLSAEGAAVAVTITWNDGSTSTATYDQTAAYVGGTTVVTKTGQVVSGRFTGDSYLEIVVGPTVSGLLDCLTPTGLTQITGTAVLEITSL